jgi:hypothetical protein
MNAIGGESHKSYDIWLTLYIPEQPDIYRLVVPVNTQDYSCGDDNYHDLYNYKCNGHGLCQSGMPRYISSQYDQQSDTFGQQVQSYLRPEKVTRCQEVEEPRNEHHRDANAEYPEEL